jgi:hypothetical protein
VTTVMPEGEAIRKAVKWISAQIGETPGVSPQKLVQNAVVRFDLSPKEAEFLMEFYRGSKTGSSSGS